MELVEIKGLFEMDTGSPSPMVISNDNALFVIFYSDGQIVEALPQQRNTVYDTGICILKFNGCIKYSFGMPGDETIVGHPYSTMGMQSYSFYQMKNSKWIRKLQDIDRVHPSYSQDKWKIYNHYIITFHDNMFECVSKDFEIREEPVSVYHQAASILNELSVKHF